jgi:hypothetical protein
MMARAANGNLRWPRPHPDALDILDDPRLDGMTDALPGFSPTRRDLVPAELPSGESRYLRLGTSFDATPGRNAAWPNRPERMWANGRGLGFDEMTERPRLEDSSKSPKRLFHFWEYGGVHVASPDIIDMLTRLTPGCFVTIPIDWVYSDGQCLDGYVFVDFIKLHYAYDYWRSEVVVIMREGKKSASLGLKRALRDDIPPDLPIFRDAAYRSDVLVSRPLAEELAALCSREMGFNNVHTSWRVELPRKRAPRNLKAKLKQAEPVADDPSMSIARRVGLRVVPLVQRGAFTEAEALLLQWLKSLPQSPFHVIADLHVTTPAQECAKFFDEFVTRAKNEHPVEAVSAELNGFTVNTDLWFCDVCAFSFHGGTDSLDWLGDFTSSADERLVITGLEPLQAVYGQRESFSQAARAKDSDADYLAGTLVIVKFQRLLQQALPLMKQLKCPLFASAHDDNEFVVEIRPER